MKSNNRFIAIAVVLVLIIGAVLFLKSQRRAAEPSAPAEMKAADGGGSPPAAAAGETKPLSHVPAKLPAIAVPSGQINPAQALTQLFAEFVQPGRNADQLVDYLTALHQDPYVGREKNEATGEMVTIRTKSPFPGTRYFHAQVITADDGSQFVQHLSFEFKAGPDAFANAVQAVTRSLPSAQAETTDENFRSWDPGNGYLVWCRKMGKDDLGGNPYNAYTEADVGTVQCALEVRQGDD